MEANTSAAELHPRADEIAAPPAPPTVAAPLPARDDAPSGVETMPVDSPASAPPQAGRPAAVTRIALMLPLRSEALRLPAEAVRAGFMAAYERERDGFEVNLIETGDSPHEALDAYTGAVATNDIVVGPLARPAVGAIASSPAVRKPTIALNHPDSRVSLPKQMLVMGLSIEDEARQVAAWAGREHPGASALVLTGPTAWQRRIANAFMAHWKQSGHTVQVADLPASNGYLSEAALSQLKARVDADRPQVLFAALDADQLRQVRGVIGTDIPCYGTSSVNPGTQPGTAMPELDGLSLLDLPWLVNPDHPAVMVYPRRPGAGGTLDLDRLYALGIDAFRVARAITRNGGAPFTLDGVTGQLSVSFGKGPARFERVQPSAVVQGTAFRLLSTKR